MPRENAMSTTQAQRRVDTWLADKYPEHEGDAHLQRDGAVWVFVIGATGQTGYLHADGTLEGLY